MNLYKFGPFRIDSDERLLFRDGQLVPLPPKAIDTLLALTAANGRVVEKADLMKLVWPHTFVEEGGLARNISLLRKVFGEGAENVSYIETIPTRGYRWVGPPPESIPDPPPPIPPPQPFPVKYRIVLVAAALVLAVYLLWPTRLNSLVVLPFRDTSPNAEPSFAAGLTDAVLTNLAKIERLKVVYYPDISRKAPAGIAAALRVEAALEGSVLYVGDRVKITVRMSRATTGEQLWAEEYEDEYADRLGMHRRVTEKILNAIKINLTPQDRARLTSNRTPKPAAYRDYTKGRFHWQKRTPEAFKKAMEYFQLAINEDPGYAAGYAGLADAYSLLGSTSYDSLSPQIAMPKAKEAAIMAVKMDDGSAEAHASLAYVLFSFDWDWSGADREFRRAIDLNPGYPTAHHWYALYLLSQGHTGAALKEMRMALDRDPLSLAINTGMGWCLYLAQNYDQSVEQYRATLELDPNFGLAHVMLGMAYERKKSYPEAIQELQKALTIAPQSPFALARLGQVYAVSGDRTRAGQVLETLNGISKTRYVPDVYPGAIYVGLGDMDNAYLMAEKAYSDRSYYVIYFNVEPSLDRFRLDPRYSGFIRRLKFQK